MARPDGMIPGSVKASGMRCDVTPASMIPLVASIVQSKDLDVWKQDSNTAEGYAEYQADIDGTH